ncbi:MAG: Flp pilus assembly complex ATPase component TadA [Candidatus Riflebacteria bacterium]|nr:Flp pilus assembly complex ATPase component TadA [Candidatus Riflebacteria bacterium]
MKPKIFRYFDEAFRLGASDLTLKTGAPPTFRINGHLIFSEEEALVAQEMYDIFLPILTTDKQMNLRQNFETFSLFQYRKKWRIRYYIYQQREGLAGSFRFIPTTVPSIRALLLPEALDVQACRPRGLFLVTGPAGAGKSHTMAAMVNAINFRFARHIITMENPIEFCYTPNQSIFTQIEIGTQIPSYQEALTNALREDPDVMMIGEMQDRKTVEMALVASETGHFVISTLPTLGAVPTLERLESFFPVDKQEEVRTQISMNLLGIFSQILIPKMAPDQPANIAYELCIINSGMRTLIRDKKYNQVHSAMLMARKEGCVTLKDTLGKLLRLENVNADLVKAMLQEIVE